MAGDRQGSVAASQQSLRLDPQGARAYVSRVQLSEAYWELGQFDAGLEQARAVVAERPHYYWGYLDVALNAVGLGHIDEARAAVAEARRLQPGLSPVFIQQTYGVSRPEVDARRNAALREAGLE